ncbi:MAG: acyl-protein synthetase, partial [Clostridiales Family XIII bacterium]|nr:acyl-protein synthetase [Clostridiales Family XIII bacterium]
MENIFNTPPFAISQEDKERLLLKRLLYLTSLHEKKSIQYKNILNALSFNKDNVKTILDIPFIPVGIFKERELLSTNKKDIIKTMTSSGTTGQAVSKIYLDKNTALLQQKALSKIVTNFLGPKRLPMLIIDSSEIIKNRELFSARGAGILGFSIFGKDINYALEKDMSLNIKTIDRFLQKYKNEKTFLFGFTFIVYDKFHNEIKKLKTKQNFIGEHKIQAYQDLFQNAILIHGGGWKRLISNAISPAKLK